MHVLYIGGHGGISIAVFENSRESNVVGIGSKIYIIDGVSEFDGVPEFFYQKVPLNREGQHDEIQDHSADCKLL